MEKKKKNRQSDLPEVSPRKKPYVTLTHRLENSGANIKISAKPEDWLKIRRSYIFSSDKLWRDFLPIMEVAHLQSIPKTKHKKGQSKIDALKVFSAILYKFLERIQQIKRYPDSLKKIHKDFEHQKDFDVLETTADFMDFVFRDYFEKMKFGQAYEDESCHYKVNIKPFYNKDGDDYDGYENFHNTYIKKGLKIIQGTEIDKLKKLLREPEGWLDPVRRFQYSPGNNDILEFLYMLSLAVSTEFTYPCAETKDDIEAYIKAMKTCIVTKTYEGKNGIRKPIIERSGFEEINFIREVLKEIFPSLPIPDLYCRVNYLPRS